WKGAIASGSAARRPAAAYHLDRLGLPHERHDFRGLVIFHRRFQDVLHRVVFEVVDFRSIEFEAVVSLAVAAGVRIVLNDRNEDATLALLPVDRNALLALER